jgi:uncharacterized protein
MYYLLFYNVVDDFLERRGPYRQEHLKLCREAKEHGELIMGGPMEDPVDGALLLFKTNDASIPERFAREDNYVKEGLVKQWRVRRWDVVFYGEPSVVLFGDVARK